jgi:hypothetical protein
MCHNSVAGSLTPLSVNAYGTRIAATFKLVAAEKVT